MPQVLLIAGAPEADSLVWQPSSLIDAFITPVARFAGIVQPDQRSALSSIDPRAGHAAWRSLQLSREHLPTGYSQLNGYNSSSRDDADFFVLADLSLASSYNDETSGNPISEDSTTESAAEVLSQFYEHSFATHAGVCSSQISAHGSQSQHESESSSQADQTSFSFSSTATNPQTEPILPQGSHLSTLTSIPNARYLQSITPQTMTVNLLCGLISISSPRTITTRRGASVDLVEFLVGDETKSGFGVNYWLPAPPKPKSQPRVTRSRSSQLKAGTANANVAVPKVGYGEDDVRSLLGALRSQDIVLLTNVALSSFRGRVYGQSLRRGVTKVQLLFRQRVDRFDAGGCFSVSDLERGGDDGREDVLVAKTRRVREWVVRFVGPGNVVVRKGPRGVKGKVEILKEVLPPDTQ